MQRAGGYHLRRSLVTLLVLATLLPALTTAAPSARHAPLGGVVTDARGVVHARDLVADARSAILAAARAPTDAALHAAALDALRAAAPTERVATMISGAGIATPMGDATGDGLSEALVVTATGGKGGATIALHVLSPGATSELWSASFQARLVDYVAGADLDGDGRADLLVVSLVAAPLPSGGEQWTWTTTAYRGEDGATLWTRSDVGASQSASTDNAFVGAASAAVFALVGGDATGDGGADVWLDVESASAAGAFTPSGGAIAGALVDRALLLSGKDGSVVSALALASPPAGFALALPAGDLDGDGLADTVATQTQASLVGPSVTLVTALTGKGAPLWAHPAPGALALGVPVPDITGDGRADVLVDARDARVALDGASGASRWSFARAFHFWVVAGRDIQFFDAVWNASAGGTDVRVALVRGASGEVAYDTRPLTVPLPASGSSSIGFVVPAGDLDGDGVPDAILDASTADQDGNLLSSDAHALRASNGQLAWSRSGGEALPALGDLTGDGRDDAIVVRLDGKPLVATLTAIDGATGADAWSRSASDASLAGFAARGGGDFGGSRAGDLLVTLVTGSGGKGGALATSVEAWGTGGATVWSA